MRGLAALLRRFVGAPLLLEVYVLGLAQVLLPVAAGGPAPSGP